MFALSSGLPLSDVEPEKTLLDRVYETVTLEGKVTVKLLLLLKELSETKEYVGLGYSSLFTFLTQRCRYSEAAAWRRIESMKVLKRYPEVKDLLLKRELNLSTLAAVSKILTDANKDEVFERVKGKSQREVERVIQEYRGVVKRPKDIVRPVLLPAEQTSDSQMGGDTESSSQREAREKGETQPSPLVTALREPLRLSLPSDGGSLVGEIQRNEGARSSNQLFALNATDANTLSQNPPSAIGSSAQIKEGMRLSVTLSSDTYTKLQDAMDFLGRKYRKGLTYDVLFNEVFSFYIGKLVRREKVIKRKKIIKRNPVPPVTPSRYIPIEVREAVKKRDNFQCAFKCEGHRCSERRGLEFEHIIPFAKGGESSVTNLTLRCKSHNLHAAVKEYGPGFMNKYLKR